MHRAAHERKRTFCACALAAATRRSASARRNQAVCFFNMSSARCSPRCLERFKCSRNCQTFSTKAASCERTNTAAAAVAAAHAGLGSHEFQVRRRPPVRKVPRELDFVALFLRRAPPRPPRQGVCPVRRSASNFLASMRRASAIANLLIFSAKMRSSWPLVRKHCDLGPVILPLELRPALTPLPVAYPLELGPALHLGSPVQGAPGGNGPSLEVGEETR
jgi:hypothetical protein